MRLLKLSGCLAALVAGLLSAPGFSLHGPFNEDWQTSQIGYELDGDIGAPKNINEEYRWNTPVVYYAFDASFLEFFGTNGIHAIESGFELFNALTNTGYSALDPNTFTTSPMRSHPQATALRLRDLKSAALEPIFEELGLMEPNRFIYTLRSRFEQPGLSCPFMIYYVVMRHFDPITYAPTPYLNGTLYTYQIFEHCTGEDPLARRINFPVDPTALDTRPVAAGTPIGSYVVGLSRDDVGGLKYLLRTNNINWESLSSDSEQFTPNRSQAQLIYSSNLWTFTSQAYTNDAPALVALYPGLVISSTTNIYTNIWVTNLTAYFSNSPWMPVDAFPQLYFATNRTLTIQTRYIHTFENVYTGISSNGGFELQRITRAPTNTTRVPITVETISSTNSPWSPVGSVTYSASSKTYKTNGVQGDFFLLPTSACGVELIALQATLVTRDTNLIVSATNVVITTTNAGGTGGTNVLFYSQSLITTESNRVWLSYPVECLAGGTNVATLRQGMDRMQFVRTSYDSLIGRFYQPITNFYTSLEVTNSQVVPRKVRRVVTSPDFLFRSEDLVQEDLQLRLTRTDTASNFNSANAHAGLAGPGNIEPNMTITFSRVGPLSENTYDPDLADLGLSEANTSTNWAWGSFDGSTNAPVLYPFGTTATDIESLILFQIISAELPDGQVGLPYSTQLEASGGQLPYGWAPSADSQPLPDGLTLSANGVVSGTPSASGNFEFRVTLTEAGGRTTTRTVAIVINP